MVQAQGNNTNAPTGDELIDQLGDSLRCGNDAVDIKPTREAVGDCQFVGVYFGAHWAPPCRKFTASLAKVYDEINDKLQIVFCSSDGDEAHFKRNFNEMKWFAIDFNDMSRKQSLSQSFGVMELPTLVILSATGTLVSITGDKDLKEGTNKALENWTKSLQEQTA